MAHRLSNGTQTNTVPAPQPVVGTPGFPTNGNPATSSAPSLLDAYWDYSVGEEIFNFVTGLGVTPDKANNGQMIAGLIAAFPGLVPSGRLINDGSNGSSGYLKLPGGLILQWIRNKITTSDGTGAAVDYFVFPIPFTIHVLGYTYVADNENTNNNDAGTVQAGLATLTQQPVVHYRCTPSASVAFSGFILGV